MELGMHDIVNYLLQNRTSRSQLGVVTKPFLEFPVVFYNRILLWN